MKNITGQSFVSIPIYDIYINPVETEIWTEKPPKRGDHIRVQRMGGIYAHHGIYVSDNEVIHFTGKDDDSILDWSKPEVIQTNLAVFLNGGVLEIKEYTDEEFPDLYSPDQIVEYARACLGDKGYNLIFNNCEHFANYCTLGRFKSNQVEQVTEGNIFMNILGKLRKLFSSSSSGNRTTTVNEPDKVKVAQIEAEAKIRLAEMDTERVELIKQAQIELMNNQAECQAFIEEARARGFMSMAQSIATLQSKLNEIAENRLKIIENASISEIRNIENFYNELCNKIEVDNNKYSEEKLPKLLEILGQYDEKSVQHKLYTKQIDMDMQRQFTHYEKEMDAMRNRQQLVIEGFLQSKNTILEQTNDITKGLIESLQKQALEIGTTSTNNLSLPNANSNTTHLLHQQNKLSLPDNSSDKTK